MTRILLVEDDPVLGDAVRRLLAKEGAEVTHVASLAAARAARVADFDLVILDWNLPDGEGPDLLRDLRGGGDGEARERGGTGGMDVPVILLTARGEAEDRVLGLDGGAVDYIVKPFEVTEFLARVRVQLRWRKRRGGEPGAFDAPGGPTSGSGAGRAPDSPFEEGPFRVDPGAREVEFEGAPVPLTRLEYELLVFLLRNANRAFSREELLTKVWGGSGELTTRTIDTHILQLRRKTAAECFETLRGVGYRYRRKAR